MSVTERERVLDSRAISNDYNGLVLDFNGRAALSKNISLSVKALTQPRVIADLPRLIVDQDIASPAIVIKKPNTHVMGLPSCFDFALSAAQAVGEDVKNLYGAEGFKKREIWLVVGCKEVQPNQALRPEFSEWHAHTKPFESMDLIYTFANRLPIEFLTQSGEIVAPLTHMLTRFGTNVLHRSPINHAKQPLRRLWGAFIVYPNAAHPLRGQAQPYNNALVKPDSPCFLEFNARAQAVLAAQKTQGYKQRYYNLMSGGARPALG